MLRSIARMLSVPSAAEMERAYLDGSVDRYELEYREREITRGKFRSGRRSYGF